LSGDKWYHYRISSYEGTRTVDWTRGAVPRPVHQKQSACYTRYSTIPVTDVKNSGNLRQTVFDGPEIGSTGDVVLDRTMRQGESR
jgi:hypothetical protein